MAQLPTSDWRDEQWVLGYGLYVNAVYYAGLLEMGRGDQAESVKQLMNRFIIKGEAQPRHVHEGLALPRSPGYALWAYKVHKGVGFDLLGNSLAILTGLAAPSRARRLVRWVEAQCADLRERGELTGMLPPCYLPYIRPGDADWRPRYARYNRPGEYHNGGIWPFIAGFYVAALVKAGHGRLAEKRLLDLVNLVRPARTRDLPFGFNEWIKAQDGTAKGQDWQSWSAAMFLYAAACVDQHQALFFTNP